ncbi:MAG: iron-sulfur cluster assembly scaffold protein [Patescibacteria group bacterium]
MAKQNKKIKKDVINKYTGNSWAYTKEVKDHFFKPKNLLLEDPKKANLPAGRHGYDAEGIVGSPACGDVMRVWLKIDSKKDKIKDFKWRTFGCASAIASTSMLSVMVIEKGGMKIDKALKIKPQDIMKRLGGLPDRKIHCSVLGDKALRTALNDWFRKTKQFSRIVVDGKQILDPNTKTTEADIEEAVLEGATTLLAVQKRTKVGIGYPSCLPKVEQLIRFYREKYFGKE